MNTEKCSNPGMSLATQAWQEIELEIMSAISVSALDVRGATEGT